MVASGVFIILKRKTMQEDQHVVSDLYDNYEETQKEIYAIETRKTRTKLITIAVVIFVFDLLALLMANLVNAGTLITIAVVPLVMLGLALLANKEPLIAMIIATLIIVGLWVYSFVVIGGRAALYGWLSKAILIYLLIAGFQNAREAQKIKRELKL